MAIVYTTYDQTKKPVRCCAHIEKTASIHEHKYGDANSPFIYEGQYFYFLYDPTKPANQICCVYYAKRVVNGNGDLVWVADTSRSALFCGDRITI